MYRLLMSYLERLPGAMRETVLPDGAKIQECIYSPHSLRATTATLLLDSSVAIESVQDLLDHKHITTTQNLRQTPPLRVRLCLAQGSDLRNGELPGPAYSHFSLIMLENATLIRVGESVIRPFPVPGGPMRTERPRRDGIQLHFSSYREKVNAQLGRPAERGLLK